MSLLDKNRDINRSLDFSFCVLRGKIATQSDVFALRQVRTQDVNSARAFMCGLCKPVSLQTKSFSMTQARWATPPFSNLILIFIWLSTQGKLTHFI